MPRLSPIAFDRPMPVPEDLEEAGLPSEDSAMQSYIKLGIAWLCATLAGISALAYSSISQFSPTSTMLVLLALLVAYAAYGYFLPTKNTVQFSDSLYYIGCISALFSFLADFVIC